MHRTQFTNDFALQYPLKILVVEDNPVNTKVLTNILRKLGYEATAVENGEEGVLQAERAHYNVVFMDLQMPVMGGLESARRIFESSKISHSIYIAAFTANVRTEDRRACNEAGMQDFVAKPASVDDIVNMLVRAYSWLASN